MKIFIDKLFSLFIFLMAIPVQVFAITDISAAAPTPVISSGPMSGQYLLQLILGLIVVLVSIVILAWLAKRVNRLQSSSAGLLTIVGGISMGSRERIVLLQVGESQLLIGVAPGRINTLHVLDTPIENITENSENNSGGNFAEKLKNIIMESAK